MAGYAPELPSPGERLWRWVADLSDFRLSLYMIALAVLIGSVIALLDHALSG
jgi:hypothetical protein